MGYFKRVNGFKEATKIQIATRLDPEDFALIVAAAEQENVCVSDAIRRIVKLWVAERGHLVRVDKQEAAE